MTTPPSWREKVGYIILLVEVKNSKNNKYTFILSNFIDCGCMIFVVLLHYKSVACQ